MTNSDYAALFPIDRRSFSILGDTWTTQVLSLPNHFATDQLLYELGFESQLGVRRSLRLWLSDAALHHDQTGQYKRSAHNVVENWLALEETEGERKLF